MKFAVLVIDVQQGLFDPVPKPFEANQVVERINTVTQNARSSGCPVFFIQHETEKDPLEYGSSNWQLHQGLDVNDEDIKIRKTTPDSFLRTDLEENLNSKGIKDLMWKLFDLTKEQMPDLTEAYYGSVKNAVYRDGKLDVKTKRLMSLAVAVQADCKDCMISQTSKAIELGATPAEIFEVCSVAVSMGGTLAWSKALVVADYLQERGLIKS